MVEEVHLNDIGTVFEVTLLEGAAVVPIDTASEMLILFRAPSGLAYLKTAVHTTDGTDGKLQYTTVLDDLDEVGMWYIQARVTLPSGKWSSSKTKFKVYDNLD